jgi:hypothetical protein
MIERNDRRWCAARRRARIQEEVDVQECVRYRIG